MAFDVKITKFNQIAEIFCPHYCLGCGKLGGILCDCCKKYNNFEHMNYCLECGVVVEGGCCQYCTLPFDGAWILGKRKEIFGEMAVKLKYDSVRAVAGVLAEMLASMLPCFEGEVRVVPLPTARRHVRMRGLDHTKLVAKEVARLRGWRLDMAIVRLKDSVQVGASAELRQKQAKEAYRLAGKVDFDATYLVLDDIYTTGASMKAGCELLKRASAKKVYAVVIAKN